MSCHLHGTYAAILSLVDFLQCRLHTSIHVTYGILINTIYIHLITIHILILIAMYINHHCTLCGEIDQCELLSTYQCQYKHVTLT